MLAKAHRCPVRVHEHPRDRPVVRPRHLVVHVGLPARIPDAREGDGARPRDVVEANWAPCKREAARQAAHVDATAASVPVDHAEAEVVVTPSVRPRARLVRDGVSHHTLYVLDHEPPRVDVAVNEMRAVLGGPVAGVLLRKDVVADGVSRIVGRSGLVGDQVPVVGRGLELEPNISLDGVGPVRGVVAIYGAQLVGLVDRAHAGVGDVPARGRAQIRRQRGGFGLNRFLARPEPDRKQQDQEA